MEPYVPDIQEIEEDGFQRGLALCHAIQRDRDDLLKAAQQLLSDLDETFAGGEFDTDNLRVAVAQAVLN